MRTVLRRVLTWPRPLDNNSHLTAAAPPHDLPSAVPATADQPAEPDAGSGLQWTGASHLVTRVIGAVLMAGLGCGPVALVGVAVVALSAAHTPPAAAVALVDRSSERAAVGEFAQQFVLAWLGASAGHGEDLVRYLGSTATVLPDQPLTASSPAVAAITASPGGVWGVTVGVTVALPPEPTSTTAAPAAPSSDPSTSPGAFPAAGERLYFQTAVTYTAGAIVADTLPAPVAGPAQAAVPVSGYRFQVDPASPVAAAAGGFLAALLTGTGDVTRFESPGTQIRPVRPAPYTAVTVGGVTATRDLTGSPTSPAAGEVVQLLVAAQAQIGPPHKVPVQYALTLAARAGRWEVRSLDPVPAPAPGSPVLVLPSSTPSN